MDSHRSVDLSLGDMLPTLTRVFVWALLFGILYTLRSIFLLVFLTFVFAYIQAQGVERLQHRIRNRTVRVVVVALMVLGILIAVGTFIAPRLKAQARGFMDRLPSYIHTLDASVAQLTERYPVLTEALPELGNGGRGEPGDPDAAAHTSPATNLLHGLFGDSAHSPDDFRGVLETVRNVGTGVLAVSSAFLLSLLFSFLIVLDLPRLTESVRSLERTRLRFVYYETAETIYNFGRILGRAFEAQVLIAFLNTVLTAIGLQVLGLGEETVFLSVIVFFCSFIPVAGVFLSSLPICLVSLQQYGFGHVSLCVMLIWIIHLIEAYYLNPKIYGHHLRMNPVIVLIILTLAGKFFHFWGLILGVPVCTYIFGHAIQYHPKDEAGPL